LSERLKPKIHSPASSDVFKNTREFSTSVNPSLGLSFLGQLPLHVDHTYYSQLSLPPVDEATKTIEEMIPIDEEKRSIESESSASMQDGTQRETENFPQHKESKSTRDRSMPMEVDWGKRRSGAKAQIIFSLLL
jgi:hypothetical protein